jgi:hypothetical protein
VLTTYERATGAIKDGQDGILPWLIAIVSFCHAGLFHEWT